MSLCSSLSNNANTTAAAFYFGTFHDLRLLRLLSDGQKISLSLAFVLKAIHELAHDMDTQSTYCSFLQRFSGVRLWYLYGIERLTVVLHFGFDLSWLRTQAHPNLMFPIVRVTIRNDVCENFFQSEIEIVNNPGGQVVALAEFR